MKELSFVSKVRNITRTYGTGFYRATLLFPQSKKEDVWTLYAFVRLPDEMIDMEHDKMISTANLAKWTLEWKEILTGKKIENDILQQTKILFGTYHIPHEYSFAFLDAMKQDLTVDRYHTYAELEQYMYGSASVVGYIISYIIGFEEGALPFARALGEAMQMANILRDVREDYEERNRIYIPKEDMNRFSVTEENIRNHKVTSEWKSLMKFEIARTRELFKKGNAGIYMLQKDGRKAVYAASIIYEAILDEIEKQQYDVFKKRARVSTTKKTLLITKALCKKNL